MYVERDFDLSFMEGAKLFFPEGYRVTHLNHGLALPNHDGIVRIDIMDQAKELTEAAHPPQSEIVTKTDHALDDLYSRALFQGNGVITGSCVRLLTEQGRAPDQLPGRVIGSIKKAVVDELLPTNIEGHSVPFNPTYGDDFTRVTSLANLRQSTGSLDTGNPLVNQEIGNQWPSLNGRLFDLNRAGGKNSVLSDLILATRLKEAFPERKDQIDVNDIKFAKGVIKGQAIPIATEYLERASKGQLLTAPYYSREAIMVNPNARDISEFRPRYQSELTSEYQYHLGSNALAALTILRFMADFQPEYFSKNPVDWRVLDQAQKDLSVFSKKQPQLFNDPNLVLLYSEHVTNLKLVTSLRDQQYRVNVRHFKSA